jgi:hypothetical protein
MLQTNNFIFVFFILAAVQQISDTKTTEVDLNDDYYAEIDNYNHDEIKCSSKLPSKKSCFL